MSKYVIKKEWLPLNRRYYYVAFDEENTAKAHGETIDECEDNLRDILQHPSGEIIKKLEL